MFHEYLVWCSSVAGLSPVTLRNRRWALARYTTFLTTLGVTPLSAGRVEVEAWAQDRAAKLSPGSWALALVEVRSMNRWLVLMEHRSDDPTRRIPNPRVPRRQPRPVSDAVIIDVLAAMADETDRAVIWLARAAGLRAMEIAGLRWVDVDLEERLLFVTGKGGHSREIPISDDLKGVLESLNRDGPAVIRRRDMRGGHMTPNALTMRMSKHLRPWGLTLHAFRHSFATAVYESSGSDLLLTRDLLGHQSVQATQIYARAPRDKGHSVVDGATVKARPRPLRAVS